MEVLRTIALYTDAKRMPFVVIGGHAVNAYGISRQTGDLDLAIRLGDRSAWIDLMTKLGMTAGQNHERFGRFRPERTSGWPIDLMLLDDETFRKLLGESIECDFGVARARVASARHLVALKLHALKTGQEHRFARDLADVIGLLRSGKTGITGADLQELCARYGTTALYERLRTEVTER